MATLKDCTDQELRYLYAMARLEYYGGAPFRPGRAEHLKSVKDEIRSRRVSA